VIVPLTKDSVGALDRESVGDMDKPGLPFVYSYSTTTRGYVVLPHTHPEDENNYVQKDSWALGMGSRVKDVRAEANGAALWIRAEADGHFGCEGETILQVSRRSDHFKKRADDPVYH
jgi:hypothetical protein